MTLQLHACSRWRWVADLGRCCAMNTNHESETVKPFRDAFLMGAESAVITWGVALATDLTGKPRRENR